MLNAPGYLGADNTLKSYGTFRAQLLLLQKESVLQDFLLLKIVLPGSENPSIQRALLTSNHFSWQNLSLLLNVCWNSACNFGLQCGSRAKHQNSHERSSVQGKSPKPLDNRLCRNLTWDIWFCTSTIQVDVDLVSQNDKKSTAASDSVGLCLLISSEDIWLKLILYRGIGVKRAK